MARGTAYEQVTRNIVENLSEEVKGMKHEMKEGFEGLNDRMTDLFNHQSSKLPQWITIVGSIGGVLLGSLIVWIITHT